MARKDKSIDSPGATPPELNNPFANLQIDGLPPGELAPEPVPVKPKKGRVVLRRETAHRGGKCVIVVDDFASSISQREIEELGRKLRTLCGCGGTTKNRSIELQGDQPARVRAFLEKEGFRVAGVT